MCDSEVAAYYHGKNVFLTGGTGFLGKVIIEKLLRSCPHVCCVYVLARARKEVSAKQRMHDILKDVLYDQLREEQPNFAAKIHVVEGDVTKPLMGLSMEDLNLLSNCIHVIVHCAATVKFDEQIKLALHMNTTGVEELIALSKSMKHLDVLLHTSTAYANCDRPHINECVYPAPVDYTKLKDSLEWLSVDCQNAMTEPLKGDRPNTYTLTKSLAESLLASTGVGVPVVIFRPSIVGAILNEPLPGWCDNLNGPGGLYLACGKGVLRVMRGDPNAIADIVPVDLCANMMLAAVWRASKERPEKPTVYNCTSGQANPLYWGKNNEYVQNAFKNYPLDEVFRRPNFAHVPGLLPYRTWTWISHHIPAVIADALAMATGRRARMVRIYKKLEKLTEAYYYFTSHEWTWDASNCDSLQTSLNITDAVKFGFDMRQIVWEQYISSYCLGIKRFILHEDMDRIRAARMHQRRLRAGRMFFTCLMCVILWRVATKAYSRSRRRATRPSLWFYLNPFSPLVMLLMRYAKFQQDPLSLPYASPSYPSVAISQ